MNTIDCIKSRRSVRKFTEEKVPHEVLEQLVELARWAPSWKNTQIARYVAVEDEALKNRIAEEATIPWNEGIIKGAPVLMVMTYVEKRCGYERDGSFSTSKGDRWQNFDCGIAAATFELAAHELGLGSVVLGIFEEEKLRELLELREQRRDLTFESAAVIDRESTNWTSALTLNRGTAHGVEKSDCVVSAEGDLVGVVSAVGYNWCTVLTVIDTDTELGARVFRTQEVAVAEGDLALMGEGKLKLSYLSADAQLLSGDVVTTSGLGGFYPGGLVIGTVESVRTGDDGLAQYAVLAPAARLGELSEVFIIKDFDIVD